MITGPRETLKKARKLRSEMTLPEGILWKELRKRPDGFKFRRQHPAGIYILDFYCAAVRLAVEVDGAVHNGEDAARMAARRSEYLRSQRVATLRVPASAVLENIRATTTRIVEVCHERRARLLHLPLHHPADGPPPSVGEE